MLNKLLATSALGLAFAATSTSHAQSLTTYGLPNGHIFLSLEASDVAASSMTTATMDRWLGHLETTYTALQELTGYTPFDGATIEIRSVRDYPGGWAVSGNPIRWHQPYVTSSLAKAHETDNWVFGLLHELGHDFDKPVWEFRAEEMASFKVAYVLDKDPSASAKAQRATLDAEVAEEERKAVDDYVNDGVIRPSAGYALFALQNKLGWQPFEQSFRALSQTSPPVTGLQRFMLLLTVLSTYASPHDVYQIIDDNRPGELNRIKHYLDRGDLGYWREAPFKTQTNLKAYSFPSQGRIKLLWDEFLANEDGYIIEYSTNGGAFAPLVSVPKDTAEYVDSTLDPSMPYEFRLRAYNQSAYSPNTICYSPYSNVAAAVEPDNVALNRPVSVDGGYSEALAVDGRPGTSWVVVGAGPHWLSVDLGTPMSVDRVVVTHAGGIYTTKDFKIQGSVDGSQWSDLVTVEGNTNVKSDHSLAQAATVRWVRLYITTPMQTSTGDLMATIKELEVLRAPLRNVEVLYANGATQGTSNQVQFRLKIANQSGSDVPLSDLTVRYWYTAEDSAAIESYAFDYAAMGAANLVGQFVNLPAPHDGADRYLEVSFLPGAGVLASHTDSGEIQVRFWNALWTQYNQVNDHSFAQGITQFAPWTHVTLYRSGVLVYGVEP